MFHLQIKNSRKLFKLIEFCTSKNLRLFQNVMNSIRKYLEEIVLNWMDEDAEDVASFLGDLKVALPRLVNHLASTIVKVNTQQSQETRRECFKLFLSFARDSLFAWET
jgi:hypothetical protein